MTLQQLKYLVAIDRHRSFALAAEALDVTQPTLSGMIGKLEEELDVKLFERTNRKVTTTSIGTKIVKQAQLILMEANRISEMVLLGKQGDCIRRIPTRHRPKYRTIYTPRFYQDLHDGLSAGKAVHRRDEA